MTIDETNKKSTLMSYKGSFIFLICTALVGYFGLGKGLGNFAILCIILILLYHFILLFKSLS